MSTHNICFLGEIRKILCGYPLLSVAMHHCTWLNQTACALYGFGICRLYLPEKKYVSLNKSSFVNISI